MPFVFLMGKQKYDAWNHFLALDADGNVVSNPQKPKYAKCKYCDSWKQSPNATRMQKHFEEHQHSGHDEIPAEVKSFSFFSSHVGSNFFPYSLMCPNMSTILRTPHLLQRNKKQWMLTCMWTGSFLKKSNTKPKWPKHLSPGSWPCLTMPCFLKEIGSSRRAEVLSCGKKIR